VHLLDGWMSYKFAPQLEVSAGRMLVPYSRQFYTHPGELLFADLSVADYAFNLPRSVGVQAAGRFKRLNYRAAAMNSIRALDGAGQRNPGSGMAGVARIDFDVLRPYGFSESSPAMPSHPQLTLGFAIGSNPVAELSELQNVPAGVRTGNMTLDAGMRWKRLTAQAAGYLRDVRSAAGAQLPAAHGFYGQGGFFVVPRTWEVAARYSSVRFAPAGPLADRELHEYTFGINRYFHDHRLKLQTDYSALRSRGATAAGDGNRVRIQLQILI
jgi:hypothetical protein